MKLEKYSFGVGDRFAYQGLSQLEAFIKAKQAGVDVTPVWNKSFREHKTIGTSPDSVRLEADAAVKVLGWQGGYYCDADHINMSNVDSFIDACDFYTLDVADYIGKEASSESIDDFVKKYSYLCGSLEIDEIETVFDISERLIASIASKVLLAVEKAGELYRHIEAKKGKGNFVTEVSMDETELAQSPIEMLFILAAIADEGIPAQTIAPKFTGRFNKGVDYVGNVAQFEKEFRDDLAVIRFAVKEFGLSNNLKLSMHSGSDKFSLYGPINRAIKDFCAGLHVKTAGTTWLEEVIGLASAGGDGMEMAKRIYTASLQRFDELCGPYATVIDIDKTKLPQVDEVIIWDSQKLQRALTQDQSCIDYNPNMRQLIHVGYKIAAEYGEEYITAIEKYKQIIAEHVNANIYDRHIKPIFIE
jgi:tagaturonate epimerase